MVVARSLRVALASASQASPKAAATSDIIVADSSLLRCKKLFHLVVLLRHLLLLRRPSSRPPRLLILGELRLHQLRLLRLLQVLNMHGEGGKLGDGLSLLLCIQSRMFYSFNFLANLLMFAHSVIST